MSGPPIISLKNVTKLYDGRTALDDLTADVPPGAVGLLGPNGAGKSTLIKALLGLVRLTKGEARVLGLDVRSQSARIRQQVGYMPEDDCFIAGLAGVRAVAYAGELAGMSWRSAIRRAHEMLDFVGLADERYREVETYSTGMKQRLRLAQALIHAPSIVFLDEPTSGLDPEGRERMLRLIRSLTKKGVSVVISTHILHDVETCCDSVVILGRGRLLVQDRIETLRRAVDESYLVRFAGEAEPFISGLSAAGFRTERTGPDEVRALPPAGVDLAATVFEVAKGAGTVVRGLAPKQTSMEEIFLRAVTGGGA